MVSEQLRTRPWSLETSLTAQGNGVIKESNGEILQGRSISKQLLFGRFVDPQHLQRCSVVQCSPQKMTNYHDHLDVSPPSCTAHSQDLK